MTYALLIQRPNDEVVAVGGFSSIDSARSWEEQNEHNINGQVVGCVAEMSRRTAKAKGVIS